jgi:hypothetical protein
LFCFQLSSIKSSQRKIIDKVLKQILMHNKSKDVQEKIMDVNEQF